MLEIWPSTQVCKGTSPICKKCSVAGHSREECQAEKPSVFTATVNMKLATLCQRQEKDILLVSIQESEKVGILRARQIARNNNESTVKTPTNRFPNFLAVKLLKNTREKCHPVL